MATGSSTTKQTLLDQIDSKVATANATEVSQLAKAINNVQEVVPEDKVFAQHPRGSNELYFERDAEFVIWCGRQHNHNHDGGGAIIYDSNLDIYDNTHFLGYHCYNGGIDGTYGHHGWGSTEAYAYGGNHCWLDTSCHAASHHCYINGTDAVGELGHFRLKMGEGGQVGYYHSHLGDFRQLENAKIGSWEVRDNRYYVNYIHNQCAIVNRFMTEHGRATATSTKHIPGQTGNNYGCTSFNRKRKEACFINPAQPVMDYQSHHIAATNSHYWNGITNSGEMEVMEGNQMNRHRCRMYYGIQQIDGATNLEKVLDDKTAKNLYFNWVYGMNTNYKGSHWQQKCTLVDNGSIFIMTQNPYTSYTLARLVRQRDDRAMRFETRQTQRCSNCYGHHDNKSAGIKIIQSRNKRNVCMYGPYYYYGAGMNGWIISRDTSREYPELWMQNTTYGVQISPFRDADFFIAYMTDWSSWGGYNRTSRIAYQNPKGHFESYWVGNQMDSQGHSTAYPGLVPLHKDGLTY